MGSSLSRTVIRIFAIFRPILLSTPTPWGPCISFSESHLLLLPKGPPDHLIVSQSFQSVGHNTQTLCLPLPSAPGSSSPDPSTPATSCGQLLCLNVASAPQCQSRAHALHSGVRPGTFPAPPLWLEFLSASPATPPFHKLGEEGSISVVSPDSGRAHRYPLEE